MLSEREKLVLNAIIDFYLTYGETIGSRTLVKKYNIELSSATIRNVMSDLEDAGFIEKTHSSSGRIPTDLGYKYYLNELLKVEKLSIEEKKRINNEYEQKISALDNILKETSSILSRLTSYASVVIEPDHRKENIKKVELVHIDDYLILAIIVTEDMNVTTKKIKLQSGITKEKLFDLSERLNKKIKTQKIKSYEIVDLIKENFETYNDIEKEIYKDIEGKLYLSNSPSIFKNKNVNEVLDVMEMFNEKQEVRNIFEEIVRSNEYTEGKVNVILGDDLPVKGLEDYSFVYSVYKKGDSKGVIGVIGPKRMPYSKTMGLIDYISKEVEKVINKEKLIGNKKSKRRLVMSEEKLQDIEELEKEQVCEKTNETCENEKSQEVNEIEALQEENGKLKAEVEDWKQSYLRKQADFQNFTKRKEKEMDELRKFASEKIITKLLDGIDNLTRAAETSKQSNDFDGLVKGVELTLNQFREIFKAEGLEAIDTEGKEFNPEEHMAVMVEASEEFEDNHIMLELQRGYKLKGKVIRPSMVKVCKK